MPGTGITNVKYGKVRVGDYIEVAGRHQKKTCLVRGIETYLKSLDHASAGDNIGIWVDQNLDDFKYIYDLALLKKAIKLKVSYK